MQYRWAPRPRTGRVPGHAAYEMARVTRTGLRYVLTRRSSPMSWKMYTWGLGRQGNRMVAHAYMCGCGRLIWLGLQ